MVVVEDECHCSDSSEPSNLTSLYTDMSSSIINCSEKLNNNNDNNNGVSVNEKEECLCRSVQSPSSDNQQLSRPVRQVSPQRYQPDRPSISISNQPVPKSEEIPVSCHCPYAYEPNVHNVPKRDQDSSEATRPLKERLNFKWPKKQTEKKNIKDDKKTYQVKVKKNLYQNYPKSYVCCEISEGIPKRKNERDDIDKMQTPIPEMKDTSEKIDIYYFDHGNSAYYRTTDAPPILATEKCAERTDYIATRFWAEIFGTIHIGMAFFTAFILQLIRFILFSIIRPLTVGIVQLTADYLLKPSLSILFNGIIQPVLILFYNIATSFRDLCEPLAEGIGFFLKEISHLFRAFRIVEVNKCQANNGSAT